MPKIEVYQDAFFSQLGRSYSNDELEAVFPAAKAELDEPVNEDGIVKIELNDTNRPDLWSTAGLARLLKAYADGSVPRYDFFSRAGHMADCGQRRVVVDPSVQKIRPYIVAFHVSGKSVDQASLKDIIQTQEKLCWNYGQKRRTIAMGVYRSQLIQYPVHYKAVSPDTTRFVPLGMTEELSLREINERHPKGQEYGHIVEQFDAFPFLTDDRGEVLSYSPVINSAKIGAVEVGDSDLFIELTGTEQHSLFVAAAIVACDLADMGFTIEPVQVEYPYDTDFGRKISTPFYFQEPQQVTLNYINKLLGVELSAEEIVSALGRMGNSTEISKDAVTVFPAAYRNDFLHPVDIIEDVMIGRGMHSFEPELPQDFTIGRLTEAEQFMRNVRKNLVGLGFQEMVFNYLGSAKDYIYRMDPQLGKLQEQLEEGESLSHILTDDSIVQILNPMSENYEFVRNSILPGLLNAESVSGNAPYPHNIFEVGKTARIDDVDNYGSRTVNTLGYVVADNEAGYNLISSQIATLMYYLDKKIELAESDDKRFIPGRCADIVLNGSVLGVFGEIHPGVLSNWGINVPAVACEIDLDALRLG